MPKVAFEPRQHGWHFNNSFVNVILPGTPVTFQTFGLCGGMVMSALDYWRAGVPIPAHEAADFGAEGVPADGSALRTYIFDRQMNSLLTALMMTRWVVMPWIRPRDYHAWAVGSEFDIVRSQIDRGRPAMLGLWAMPGGGNGHQVLCYGYDENPRRLWVYDPNNHSRESLLVPVSARAGCEMRDARTGTVLSTYRGYFWSDVYNWNEAPPYEPRYRDLELAEGLTLEPSGDNVSVGGRINASVTVRNGGEYPSRFKNLCVWTRGPNGENLDQLLGGIEAGIGKLHPGEQHLIARSCDSFGARPGQYVVGVSYLSRQDRWLNLTRGAPATQGQQRLVLRANTNQLEDKVIEVRERDLDIDTGVTLKPGMEFALSASGAIWAGVWFTGLNGPEGWVDRLETNPRSPLHSGPSAHPFSLVARFEGRPYFYVGKDIERRGYDDGTPRRLWLRINDDTPGNGSGSFRCRVRVWG